MNPSRLARRCLITCVAVTSGCASLQPSLSAPKLSAPVVYPPSVIYNGGPGISTSVLMDESSSIQSELRKRVDFTLRLRFLPIRGMCPRTESVLS